VGERSQPSVLIRRKKSYSFFDLIANDGVFIWILVFQRHKGENNTKMLTFSRFEEEKTQQQRPFNKKILLFFSVNFIMCFVKYFFCNEKIIIIKKFE
jgi:hypothetical protein